MQKTETSDVSVFCSNRYRISPLSGRNSSVPAGGGTPLRHAERCTDGRGGTAVFGAVFPRRADHHVHIVKQMLRSAKTGAPESIARKRNMHVGFIAIPCNKWSSGLPISCIRSLRVHKAPPEGRSVPRPYNLTPQDTANCSAIRKTQTHNTKGLRYSLCTQAFDPSKKRYRLRYHGRMTLYALMVDIHGLCSLKMLFGIFAIAASQISQSHHIVAMYLIPPVQVVLPDQQIG